MRIMSRIAAASFFVAFVLVGLLVFLSLPVVQSQLEWINNYFIEIENFIAQFDKFTAFAVILFFFCVKSVISFVPYSVLFIGSGLVFSAPTAVCINAIGYGLLASIKFLWGRRFGGGSAHRLMLRSSAVTDFMKLEGHGNRWMLSVLQFIPFIPVGSVSRAYGATDMRYLYFVALSVLGVLPRLISWSIVGCNITNPFTPGFVLPFVGLSVITGISALIVKAFLKLNRKDEKYEKE